MSIISRLKIENDETRIAAREIARRKIIPGLHVVRSGEKLGFRCEDKTTLHMLDYLLRRVAAGRPMPKSAPERGEACTA